MDCPTALRTLGTRYPEITKQSNGGPAFGRRQLATLSTVLRNAGFSATQVTPHIASLLRLAVDHPTVVLIADTILSTWAGA